MTPHIPYMSPRPWALDRPEPCSAPTVTLLNKEAAFRSVLSVLVKGESCHRARPISKGNLAATVPATYYRPVGHPYAEHAIGIGAEIAWSAISTRNIPPTGAQFSTGFTCRPCRRRDREPAD